METVAKQFLNTPGAKPPGYTHVVTSTPGRMVFVSGRGGNNPDGTLSADFETQCVNTFEELKRCLEMAGAKFEDVVKVNYFITDMEFLVDLRRIRARYLHPDRPPAATLVQAGLLEGLLIEIECIAIVAE
jgi:enamine deaminase RidA (YjgF/YER057c/UK114 family)